MQVLQLTLEQCTKVQNDTKRGKIIGAALISVLCDSGVGCMIGVT